MVTGKPEVVLYSRVGVYVGGCNEHSMCVCACEYIEGALNVKHSSVATGGSYASVMCICA